MLYRRELGKYIMEHSYKVVLNHAFWRLFEDKEKSSPKNTMFKKQNTNVGGEWGGVAVYKT